MIKLLQFHDNKKVYSWALYDWANSAFATTIMAAVLPAYFSKVAAGNLAPNIASSIWGYTNTIAMLSMALMAPILGAIADYKQSKLRFLAAFALLGIIFTGMLYAVQYGDWMLASFCYILGRIGFSGANVFYDSLLPHLARRDNIDRISAVGYAAGYLGGGLLLAVNIAMITSPQIFAISDTQTASRLSFISVAVWWAVFSIPLLKNLDEPRNAVIKLEAVNPIKVAFQSLLITFKKIRYYKQAFRFLIAFWLYNDGIGTIIVMAVVFGAEIGIGNEHLIGAILAVQFVGIPFTLIFAKLAAKITAKRAIYLGLVVYSLISIGGYFMQNALHFWLLAIFVGMVQGGTQALSRSVFGQMTPPNKSAEFFGFFDVSQKFSGILGPAIFALVGSITGTSRLSIIALIIFFVGGMVLLKSVNISEGVAAVEKSDSQNGTIK
jgi:UMF1 family MFS transporter